MNHEFFWKSLAPISEGGGVQPKQGSELFSAINESFGSFECMIENLSDTTNGMIFGADWGWLAFNQNTGRLEVHIGVNGENNDIQLNQADGLVPLLSTEIWDET